MERPARAAARGRPLARALQGDGAPRGDEVLDRAHDRLGDRQLDQPVRGDGGVGAVDEAVARAQVQQRRLPPLDAGRGGGQGWPGAALFRQVLQGDRVRPFDDGRGDLDDGAVDPGEVVDAEACGQDLVDGHHPGGHGQHHTVGGVLAQELAAAPARREGPAVGVHAGEGDQAPSPGAGELGDEAALGAQGDAVAGVLHVASRDESAVVDQGGGPDLEAGVGGVGVGHGLHGELVQGPPVGVGQFGGHDAAHG